MKKIYERVEVVTVVLTEDLLTASPALKVYGAGDDNGVSDIDWFFE